MKEETKSYIFYAAKCVIATMIVFTVAKIIHYNEMGWSLISVVLILSPDGKDAVKLALMRIKANFLGASIGFLCLLISPNNMWIMCAALTLTLAACYIFRFDAATRSALAATIIIMLHQEGKHLWTTALERVIAVLSGCSLGLLITFVFHFNVKTVVRKVERPAE